MITQETKAKIYALYYGQKILNHTDSPGHVYTVGEAINIWDCATRGYYLHLNGLSYISDEDAIQVANILGLDKTDTKEHRMMGAREHLYDYEHSKCWCVDLEIIDFLRSEGYAIPAFGHSIGQLVESGIFKLKIPTLDGK